MDLFEEVYDLLEQEGKLPLKYKPHPLKGKWLGFIDAPLQPDWVLIYKVNSEDNTIDFVRMGTHSDLF